jgi:membrane protein DedA with SNARE-associated domain
MAEGESGLVLAGVLSYTGHMFVLPAIIVAGIGGALGDLLFFHLGKYHTDVVKDKIKNNEIIIEEIQKILKKHDILVIFVQRYLYGLRTIIPIVIGMSGYNEKRFFSINLISAFI